MSKEKELSLICCVIRDNEIFDTSVWTSFDKTFEIAEAFVQKYGVDTVQWADEEMDYEETVLDFANEFLRSCANDTKH